jgi:hypothetical protein
VFAGSAVTGDGSVLPIDQRCLPLPELTGPELTGTEIPDGRAFTDVSAVTGEGITTGSSLLGPVFRSLRLLMTIPWSPLLPGGPTTTERDIPCLSVTTVEDLRSGWWLSRWPTPLATSSL